MSDDNSMTLFFKNYQRGFTLVESLVAITILMIGVVGPLVIASRGISDGLYAQNQLAANYLAQEAVSTIINRRDHNLGQFPEVLWLDGIDTCFGQSVCAVNGKTGVISTQCNDLTPCNLVYDRVLKLYREAGNNFANRFGPIFTRDISIKKGLLDDNGEPLEIEVAVTISWRNRSVAKDFTLVEHLYRNQATELQP